MARNKKNDAANETASKSGLSRVTVELRGRKIVYEGDDPTESEIVADVMTDTGLVDDPIGQLGNPEVEHIHAPHGRAYESIKTEALFQRIESDIMELVARVYHLSVDRWVAEPPMMAEFEVTMEKAKTDQETRARIAKGLGSGKKREREKADKLRRELNARDMEEARQAAIFLAEIGRTTARRLEFLSNERLELFRSFAGRIANWPVNLGLEKPTNRSKRSLTGRKDAEDYLRRLDVNLESFWPKNVTGSPFRLAAQQVYEGLRVIRSNPARWFSQDLDPTPWGKKLLNLREPMTEDTAVDWWVIAKVLIDHKWKHNQADFATLIKLLNLKELAKSKPAIVKRRVVDDSLKKAFKALAAGVTL